MFTLVQNCCGVVRNPFAIRQTLINFKQLFRKKITYFPRTYSDCRRNYVCRMDTRKFYNIKMFTKKRKWYAILTFQVVAAKYLTMNAKMEGQIVKEQTYIIIETEGNVFSRTWVFMKFIFRVLQLFLIFFPAILATPLLYMGLSPRDLWHRMFVDGIEISGPVMVKLGQWASTRRDLFSAEVCFHLSGLQRRTTPHSWDHTEKILKEAYGPEWDQVIKHINHDPIGSGCCAQVYKAWIKPDAIRKEVKMNKDVLEDGFLPVAVKVVHPNMKELLRRDLSILRTAAITINWLFPSLRWLSFEECVEEFSQVMKAQVDMCVEAKNLEKFTKNFARIPTIKFPQPIWSLTQPDVLVETFESGDPLLNFVIDEKINSEKTLLADIGIKTILKMVFDDNFVHGDMHPGNMLVQSVNFQSEKETFLSLLRKSNPTSLRLVILDCGIVASLDERGKKALRDVFTAVVNSDGRRVAELFLEHSNHGCTDTESFKVAMDKIVKEALNKTVTLEKIQVSSLMTSLFSTMINHRVKLDGSFSSVILAIMVLEGLGRSLDPRSDIVEKAKPFLIGAL